jgi:hypothetical protein
VIYDALPEGFILELSFTRQTLDQRYADVESGKVKLIPGEEVFARLRAKSAARRTLAAHPDGRPTRLTAALPMINVEVCACVNFMF